MKYKLSRDWVLREDRLKAKNEFTLFSITSKEKKFINEPTFLLLRIFETKGADIEIVGELLDTLLVEKNVESIIDELISQSILVTDFDCDRSYAEYEDLISDEKVSGLAKKYSIPLSSTPESAEIHFTNTCNLSCDYCAYSAEPKRSKIISGRAWSSIFDQLEQMKICEITLSGGELFLHPEIEYLLKDLSSRRFAVTIFTNGSLVKESHIPMLKSRNMKVGLSLDGIDRKSHETYRGKNSLKKVLDTVRLFYENEVYYYFSTTVHRMNWENIEELIRYGIKFNAKAIEMGKVAKVGRSDEQIGMHLSASEVNSFADKINALKKKYTEIDISFRDIKENVTINDKDNYLGVFCTAGTSRLAIDPKGDVYPCVLCFDDKDFLIHNALDSKISDNWSEGNWPLVRETINIMQLGKCGSCGKNQYCEEVNCRLSAYYATKGNIYGSTPFCIYS